MVKRDSNLLEIVRRKVSMSAEIVSKIDADYAKYAGGSFEIGSKIATIDVMLENNLIPQNIRIFIKLYREYLNKQRKAFFATIGSTEITKLGFIQGDPRKYVKATDPASAHDT